MSEGVELVIGIPHAAVTPITMDWVGNLLNMNKSPSNRVVSWKGLPVHIARNATISDAIALKARYLLFLDADVIPPANAYDRLKSWHLPIVSGLYYSKRGYPAAWKEDPEFAGKYNPIDFKQFKNDGLIRVDAMPMGICLIDLRVFDVIPYGDNGWVEWTAMNPRVETGLSEDFAFSKKAIEYGFRLWVDRGCRCLHEAVAPFDPDGEADMAGGKVKVGNQK